MELFGFFLEENDHAKATEMAMIMYNGAKEAALAATNCQLKQ